MEIACQNCIVSNDLDLWPTENLEIGFEIECPNCGALHYMVFGNELGELQVSLVEDNG